jgi:hypothetical protein
VRVRKGGTKRYQESREETEIDRGVLDRNRKRASRGEGERDRESEEETNIERVGKI